MRKKNGAGVITHSDFRLYYKYSNQNSIWSWHKNRHIDQGNKIEIPEIMSALVVNQSMTKEARIYNGEKTISSINDTGKI